MKILLASFLLILAFQVFLGQKTENLVLFHSVSEANCEDLLSILGSFQIGLSNTPDWVGFIVIHGGENPIENWFHQFWFIGHLKPIQIHKNRIQLITTKGEKQMKFDFWLSKNGKKPNITEEGFDYKLTANKKYHFVEESVEIAKIEGGNYIIGDCPACCIRTFNSNLLAKFLNANPDWNAKIIIYNKTSKKDFNRVSKLIAGELVKEEKVPRNRLKIIYGGKKEGLYIWNNKMSVLDVSLVPNKKSY